MIRGRRVVVWVFIFFAFLFLVTQKVSAIEPSDTWKNAIGQYSQVILETQNPALLKPVKISVVSKGLLEEIIPNQKIKIKVTDDNNSSQEATLLSRQDGTTGYAFVPTHYGNYVIHAENITYEKPISLLPLQFSIQKPSSLLDTLLQIFLPKNILTPRV